MTPSIDRTERQTPPPVTEPFLPPAPEDLPDWVEPATAERYAEATAREQSATYLHYPVDPKRVEGGRHLLAQMDQ